MRLWSVNCCVQLFYYEILIKHYIHYKTVAVEGVSYAKSACLHPDLLWLKDAIHSGPMSILEVLLFFPVCLTETHLPPHPPGRSFGFKATTVNTWPFIGLFRLQSFSSLQNPLYQRQMSRRRALRSLGRKLSHLADNTSLIHPFKCSTLYFHSTAFEKCCTDLL